LKGFVWIGIILALLLGGCQVAEKPQESVQKTVELPAVDPLALEEAKDIAKKNRRVDEVAAVALKDELYVGLKVTNFNRLFLRSVRKDVHGRLREQFPNREIHVTTDSKVFGDLSQLEQRVRRDPWKDREGLRRKLDKIHEDLKG
jgi:PBP1b-binding outer membrane lipoprotein LpoB